MTKEDAAAILWGVQAHTAAGNSIEYSDKLQSALALAINALNAPNTLEMLETLKRVSKAYEQCAWERDIAIGQLRELGYSLGEKIRTDSGTISRQAAIDAIDDWWITVDDNRHPVSVIKALPSVQSEQLDHCPIYGGMCGYPSNQCYDCPRHDEAKNGKRNDDAIRTVRTA